MFKLIKIENGRQNVPEPEYLVAGASALLAGQAVSLSSGAVVKNTTAPTHITLASAVAGGKVPCVRIDSDQVYEVAVSASPTNLNVGDKVTLASTGTEVTATKDGGIAIIVSIDDAKVSGDKVTVRF